MIIFTNPHFFKKDGKFQKKSQILLHFLIFAEICGKFYYLQTVFYES